MKKLVKILSFLNLIWFLAISVESSGQFWRKKDSVKPTYGFHLEKGKNTVTIPFEVYSNLIVLKATIDASDTLNFILDTGVSSIFITDPRLADRLGFEYVREVSISGAGEEEALRAQISVGHEFNLEKINGYMQNVVVLSKDILQLSEFMGVPIHGIFGHTLFENFVVSIDFNTLLLTITNPDKFKLRRKHGESYPIVVTQNKPYTDAISLVENAGGEKRSMRLVIDTGAGHALLLNSDEGHIELPEKVIRANLGRGLNGDIYGNIGRVSKVSMGNIEMNDVIASFPDSLSFSMKFPPTDIDRQGSIGGEFLRRFKVTFNYRAGYMALKANKNRLKQPFEHDMSGMDVRAYASNLKRFYIKDIVEGSPADEAGLLPNDEILFLNRKHVEEMTVTEIYRILSRKEGKTIDIFYRRKGVIGVANFQLRRAI